MKKNNKIVTGEEAKIAMRTLYDYAHQQKNCADCVFNFNYCDDIECLEYWTELFIEE